MLPQPRAAEALLCHLQEEDIDTELTPKQVVAKLDRYIVGQVAGLRSLVAAATATLSSPVSIITPDGMASGGRKARGGQRAEE